MSDNQRKQLCRISFVVFAVLPTILVLTWLFKPRTTYDWESIGSQVLDWDVAVASHSQNADGSHSLHSVTVSDSQLGDALAINHLQVVNGKHQLTLVGDHLELNSTQLETFVDDLVRRFFIRRHVELCDVNILLHRVSLLPDPSSDDETAHENRIPAQTFEDVELTLSQEDGLNCVNIRLRPAGDFESERVAIELAWSDSDSASPALTFSISTGRSEVPCALARCWLPFLSHLGEEARFRGNVRGAIQDENWTAEIEGHFLDVDLYQFVSVPLHHTVSGLASVRLTRMAIVDGRIIGAAGRFECQQGQMDQSLTDSAIRHLLWREAVEPRRWPVRFESLEFAFRTDGEAVEIKGNDAAQGAIAYLSGGTPWLYESSELVVSTSDFFRFLVPLSGTEIPLTKETASLVSLLPLPTQASTSVSPTGTSRIRLEAE